MQQAREFNGVDQGLFIDQAVVTAAPVTVSMWARYNAAGDIYSFCVGSDSTSTRYFNIGIGGTQRARMQVRDSGTVSINGTTINTGQVYHLAGTVAANGDMELFLDGVSDGTAVAAPAFNLFNKTGIGIRHTTAFARWHNGSIDRVTVHDSVLSLANIVALRDGANPRSMPGTLLGYWQISGNTPEADISGNGLDMALTGTPAVIAPIAPSLAPALTTVLPNPSDDVTLLTLTGEDFTGATRVDFGATQQSTITVVSDTSITCLPPGGLSAGAHDVTVVGPGGTSNIVSWSLVSSAPTLNAIVPNVGTGGTAMHATGTGFSGANPVFTVDGVVTPVTGLTDTDFDFTVSLISPTGVLDCVMTTGGGASPAVQITVEEEYIELGGFRMANVGWISDTEIQAELPPEITTPGTYNMVVRTYQGTSAPFMVEVVFIKQIASIQPASGPPGEQILITMTS